MKNTNPAENIYNLIPTEEVKIPKPPRYTSTFRDSVKLEENKNKAAHKTMGPAKVEVPSPKEFLHKHTKETTLTEKSALYDSTGRPPRCLAEEKRPPVPQRTEQPIMGVQTNKSFITTNVAEAVMAVPKKPQPIYVDTKKGDKHLLETSGLVPKYLKKKDYGSTPEYLAKRNEEVRRAQEEYDAYVKERLRMGAMKQLSEEERQCVLEGIKKNWDQIHHEYQSLSVVIDTPLKKAHKERMEAEMRQLEKDMDTIERHKIIYIANN
ncbi:enkurin [Bufo gargarizans]|uniref:enkurin n=1 Tax=Bufo gargarizans TaxID=30331 RepID=UPI001CF415D6|nr:enkurin [Bufo gargarizans]